MLKTVFMGTPKIAADVLGFLCENKRPPFQVITQPARERGRGRNLSETPVQETAKKFGIPVLATPNVNEPQVEKTLRDWKPDLLLVVAFGQILSKSILAIPSRYAINVHTSLLPKYRGAAPVQRAILNGENVTGISIQKMVYELDAGDILLNESLSIEPTETSEQLLDRMAPVAGKLLWKAIELIEKGQAQFTPQDPEQVSFAKKINRELAPIDWNRSAQEIMNQIRALQPWPIAETHLEGVRLRVFKAEIVPGRLQAPPGSIQTDSQTFLKVQCGGGQALSLTEVQLENRKKLNIKAFLAAYRGHFPYASMQSQI